MQPPAGYTLTVPRRHRVTLSHPETGERLAEFETVTRATIRVRGLRVEVEPCAGVDRRAASPRCQDADADGRRQDERRPIPHGPE